MAADPLLLAWLDAHPGALSAAPRTLVVGAGLGDDAEALRERGAGPVTAFATSPTAVRRASERFPGSTVTYVVADLTDPPDAWRLEFDLVVEARTLQVLPPDLRARAAAALVDLVAPGGRLLVVARARGEHDHPGEVPWPLTRREVAALAGGDLELEQLDEVLDDEDPPVARLVATFLRRCSA